jgi:hypothetical protein
LLFQLFDDFGKHALQGMQEDEATLGALLRQMPVAEDGVACPVKLLLIAFEAFD